MARRTIAPRVETLPPADLQTKIPPIWKEGLWPIDWMALRMSPTYYGLGVPRGDGSPVVLVPGFMGTDVYLYELYLWLGRIGYRPYMSGIGVNAECAGHLTQRLQHTVTRARLETGKPVRIVGHSLGGMIARNLCQQRPDLVHQLIHLGSPLQAVHAHPALVATASMMLAAMSMLTAHNGDCLTSRCQCGFQRNILKPLPEDVHHGAVYTRADGVVDWHDAQEPDARLNHEVGGTHIGLVYNPRAYRVLARLLADPTSDKVLS